MRRIWLGLLLVLLIAAPVRAGVWLTGQATNPAANQVILTTPSLQDRPAEFVVYVRTTVAVNLALERRNAAGVAYGNDSVTLPFDPSNVVPIALTMTFVSGDTFRIRVVTGVTGTVQAAIRVNEYCLSGLGCAR
ncbi:MAG TPA: hypothetical protein VI687_01895 [Candidatus Limnocylindrales bacterium]|nr:hypothetical protein [Candidatus Limnocylindrales bacterium]